MGLGVLPGRELELVCQLVKRGVNKAGKAGQKAGMRTNTTLQHLHLCSVYSDSIVLHVRV
jgi:hypothetical protein